MVLLVFLVPVLQVSVGLPRFLDASLIHVDSHPTYITIVIKGKVLRLRFPEEVNSDAGTAKRSATSGELVITLPKVNTKKGLSSVSSAAGGAAGTATAGVGAGGKPAASSSRVRRLDAPKKLGDAMLEEASKAVSVAGIVRPEVSHMTAVKTTVTKAGGGSDTRGAAAGVTASSAVTAGEVKAAVADDDDVPPLE